MKHTTPPARTEPLTPGHAHAGQSSRDGGTVHQGRQGRQPNASQRPEPVGDGGEADRLTAKAPHLVIRGAKSPEGRTCGIDWFRVSGPFSHDRFHQLQNLLTRLYGQPDPAKGRWFYDHGMKWQHSVLLLWSEPGHEDDPGGLCVDLPGDALNSLHVVDMLRLMFRLLHGNHCTRIDLREDHWAEHVGLIEAVKRSCDAGELCKARRWQAMEPKTNRGHLLGNGVTIGKRGKDGSGRYIRVYDKGLETGEADAGTWERLEVEFSGDVSRQVAFRIAELGDPSSDCQALQVEAELAKRIREFIYGAVDFRMNNGSAELDRRPRAAWWQKLIDGISAVTVKQMRVKTTLESFAVWMRRCVAPALYDMAKASRQDVGQVVTFLAGSDVRGKPHRPIVKEFSQYFPIVS